MKRITTVILTVLILTFTLVFSTFAFQADIIQVSFSPRGGCTENIVDQIKAADSEILVQAYSFTSTLMTKALMDAHNRGVKVKVILDKSQRFEPHTSAIILVNAGISTYVDAKHAIAHNNVIIIDQMTVITGSFNYTKDAEVSNAENLLVIRIAVEIEVRTPVILGSSEVGVPSAYFVTFRKAVVTYLLDAFSQLSPFLIPSLEKCLLVTLLLFDAKCCGERFAYIRSVFGSFGYNPENLENEALVLKEKTIMPGCRFYKLPLLWTVLRNAVR
ncbi:MAG: phospholipase D family protein [Smithellaceae bacterium]|nr:phospholipase D family protein [Smithellaceae bacterium]